MAWTQSGAIRNEASGKLGIQLRHSLSGQTNVILNYVRSAVDHALGRPKTAYPTRYHYIEVLRDILDARNIDLTYLGQHCLVLNDKATDHELIVVVRYTTDSDLKLLEKRKQNTGSRIAFLIDDDYWAMLEDDKLRPDYRARLSLFLTGYFNRLYPLLDAVVAPSAQILDRLPDLPGTLVQPAHLSPMEDFSHFDEPQQINMVFLGTSTHGTDFQKVAPGISAALTDNPKLHLTTLLGKRGGDILAAGPQVNHLGDMFFPRFQSWLASQRFHIGLAPYEPNPVNNGRSNLKLHQHAQVGAAGLYSRTSPFLDHVENGIDGLILECNAHTWRQGIGRVGSDLALAKSIARAGTVKSKANSDHNDLAATWSGLLQNQEG